MSSTIHCAICGWPLDDEHVFNVNCAVANAENDQIEAEVAEAQAYVLTPEEQADSERMLEIGMEVMHDVIALKNFERMLREP